MIASFPSFPELMARLLANTATCAQPGYFSSIKHVQKQEKKKKTMTKITNLKAVSLFKLIFTTSVLLLFILNFFLTKIYSWKTYWVYISVDAITKTPDNFKKIIIFFNKKPFPVFLSVQFPITVMYVNANYFKTPLRGPVPS